MKRPRLLRFLVALALVAAAASAQAQIFAVSGKPAGDPDQLTSVQAGGDPTQVAVNLANGFPVWYQDADNGRKYQLCLDSTLTIAPGVVVNPCEYEPPLAVPPSFPANFGAEAIYWSAVASGFYTSSDTVQRSVLLTLGLEATGANEAALVDGNQAVVSSIRLRLNVPVAGTYRVTHPYGSREYVVAGLDLPQERQINQTQEYGLDAAQNFLAAMADGQPPTVAPVPPSRDVGVVNETGNTIGPFLEPAATLFDPITFRGGPVTVGTRSYIGLPFAPPIAPNPLLPVDVEQPVVDNPLTPPDGGNFLRIELLNPPADFFLNAADSSQVVQIDDFQLIGKLFDDGANLRPVARDDTAATAKNRSVSIDVLVNDTDVVFADSNVHGINIQAIAVADPATDGPFVNDLGMPLITAEHRTALGGTVRRTINAATGRASFLYTPPDGYAGVVPDTFHYVVQDSGGLISAPATVTITVEDLQLGKAEYRARTGKWTVQGTSSDLSDNRVTLTAGPRANLTPAAVVPAGSSEARGRIALRVNQERIEFLLNVDPLPATAVTAVHIHVGGATENGPVIFSLHQTGIDAPFTGSRSGILQSFNLQSRPAQGISSFADAVHALLSGNAYVDVDTGAFSAGEIRGQLIRPVIGTAEVTAAGPSAGQWEFKGRSKAGPGGLPEVVLESANGIRLIGTPLRLR